MRLTLSLSILALVAIPATAQQEVEWSDARWTLRGNDTRVEEYLGREALRLRNGSAALAGVEFENGTIEYDVATSGHRSFIGVAFRTQDEPGHYEHFYLRPHNSGRFDALQYTPVFHGNAAWQLYPEYNASVEIPTDTWLHVKLEIRGPQMRVFVGEGDEPDLVIDELRRGKSRGKVAIVSFFPANSPDGFYPTAYSNFVVTADDASPDWPATKPLPAEFLCAWNLSTATAAPDGTLTKLPEPLPDGKIRTECDTEGRINLARWNGIPEGSNRGIVTARVVLRSDRKQTKALNFGFSDRASVFLNGRLLFTGDNTYRSRSGRYLGVMTIDNDALYLPLDRGDNELVFVVSEAFGGWGLTARLADLDGVTVRNP